MIKYLKCTDGVFIPTENVIGMTTSANDVNVHVKGLQGTATDDDIVIDGGTDGNGVAIAEALIEEINFGKQVIIDLLAVHASVTAAPHND
jgi:hypothetical protein